MRRVRRVCSFRRCCFSRWPTVPISAISSAPGDFLPVLPHGWLPAALLALLFAGVVPRVLDPAERIGVAVYGAVIAGMLYSVLRYRGAYAAWFRFAALLFVFSDGVIAWSRFIGAVPGRTYVVMVPYYLAQCLFFCFAVKSLPALPSEGRSV